jgi:pimeloyl-ACP methyl ester carboxylesterase
MVGRPAAGIFFEQSGHMTFVEQPEEYVAVVRAFLNRVTL